MSRLSRLLSLWLLLPLQCLAATATIDWTAPTQNTDGSALAASHITRFNLYRRCDGGAQQHVTQIGPAFRHWLDSTVPNTAQRCWYAMTVTTATGTSAQTSEAQYFAEFPGAPLSLVITWAETPRMALSRTNRHQQSSEIIGGSTDAFTTSSFTPADNTLLVAVVHGMNQTNAGMRGTDLTITDSAGLTWTSRVATTASPGSWSYGTRIWTAPVTTGASMTVSADCGAFSIHAWRVEIYEYSGYDTGSPVGGVIEGSDADGDGAATITLSSTPATTSEVLAAAHVLMNAGTATVTHGTGWTELFESAVSGWATYQAQARSGSTSTSVAWDDLEATGNTAGAVLVAVEIKEAAAGGATVAWNQYAVMMGH